MRITGATKQTVGRWVDLGMPKIEHGKYSLFQALAWAFAHSKGIHNKDDAERSKKEEAELRLLEAKAEIEEEKLAKIKGELIPIDEVEENLIKIAVVMSSKLRAIPAPIAKRCEGRTAPEIEKLLKKKIHDVVLSISKPRIRQVLKGE